MARSIWKGSIRFSLVWVPVEAFTAAEPDEGEIRFNQLHDECHSRIRHQKVCPLHGQVTNDEIVSGYEYAKDQYVVVDKAEIKEAQEESDRNISIDTFVAADEIDPIYFSGRTYYLAPQNKSAEKPYALLYKAMDDLERWGLAHVVMHGKELLVLLRPVDGVLAMIVLHYQSQIRKPQVVKDEVPSAKVNSQELKLAEQLIQASTADKFDFAEYEDHYTDKLRALIDDKLAGKETVAPATTDEEVPVINLMEALKRSMAETKRGQKPTIASKKRTRRTATKAPPAKRRKSS